MSSTAFVRKIFNWLRQVNHDRRLLAIDIGVAVELTHYFNEKDHGGRAWPGGKRLGDAIGVHETTVLRSVDRLKANGHLYVVPGRPGSGHSNQYWMSIKPAGAQVSKPAPTQEKNLRRCRKKPAGAQETLSRTHLSSTEDSKESSVLGERGDRAARDHESTPPGAAPDGGPGGISDAATALGPDAFDEHGVPLAGSVPFMITQNMKRRLRALGYADEAIAQLTPQRAYEILAGRAPPDGAKNNHAPAGDVLVGDDPGDGSSSGGGLGQAWHELRGIYRRGHASDDTDKAVAIARAAYAKAIGEGAQPEQIIEAAKQWIAAADAPRSLPSLATWLETRSFEKPPPEKKPRKQQAWSGPPRGYRPRKPDLAAMMRALGEEG